MTTASPTDVGSLPDWTVADLLDQLGGIPPRRVLLSPIPGTATEQDLVHDAEARRGRICELVDGVLVEKAMGSYESAVALALTYFVREYLRRHPLGVLLGESGMVRLLAGRVRSPDLSFLSWERLGSRHFPWQPVLAVPLDLAVEVLSESNTKAEMEGKLREYFAAGVRLVWYIDPRTRTAGVYTAADHLQPIEADGSLTGGEVLPGFTLSLRDLFAEADQTGLSV
jgi:Uma2 family endonuclease